MTATRFIALHVNRDKDASARGCRRIICFPISNRRLERFPNEQNSSFMPWRLIDKSPQNVNGFRYVSAFSVRENEDIALARLWFCYFFFGGGSRLLEGYFSEVETVGTQYERE